MRFLTLAVFYFALLLAAPLGASAKSKKDKGPEMIAKLLAKVIEAAGDRASTEIEMDESELMGDGNEVVKIGSLTLNINIGDITINKNSGGGEGHEFPFRLLDFIGMDAGGGPGMGMPMHPGMDMPMHPGMPMMPGMGMGKGGPHGDMPMGHPNMDMRMDNPHGNMPMGGPHGKGMGNPHGDMQMGGPHGKGMGNPHGDMPQGHPNMGMMKGGHGEGHPMMKGFPEGHPKMDGHGEGHPKMDGHPKMGGHGKGMSKGPHGGDGSGFSPEVMEMIHMIPQDVDPGFFHLMMRVGTLAWENDKIREHLEQMVERMENGETGSRPHGR